MSYRKSVLVGAKEKKGRQYANFFLFKKNKRGEYQRRMLQVDVSNSLIRNVKNFREKERQRFRFVDVKLAIPDDRNPLELVIEFNNHNPFFLYLYTPSQRDELCTLLNDIVKNTADKKDTQLNINENLLKEGGADYKKKTIGWDRRYLYLYPLYLHCFSQDNSDVSRHVINLFSTPISKEGEKLICIHSDLQPYTFRFDTTTQRDDWFTMLIKASHNEGFEWEALSEDVDFANEYGHVKKEVDEAAELVRSAIIQNTASAKEKLALTRDIEAMQTTRKNAQYEITKARDEKTALDNKTIEIKTRVRELKELVATATSSLTKAEAEKKTVEDKFKANHDVFLVVQSSHQLVNGDLAEVAQQYKEVENSINQIDSTISDSRQSPELLEAQIAQIHRETSLASDKLKAEEAKVATFAELETSLTAALADLEKRKEEAIKARQSAQERAQTVDTDHKANELALSTLRAEVDQATEQEKRIQKEIEQTKDMTASVTSQTESLQKEIAAF